jgi:hypothetical protein
MTGLMAKDSASWFNNKLRRRLETHPSQAQLTPLYVLNEVRRLLGQIELDPCTEPDNPTEAERFYCLPTDGCVEPWDAATIYCNPPYGEVRDRWVKRCIAAARQGCRVILLMPSSTETRTFQLAFGHCTTAIFIGGRLKFRLTRENGRQRAASHGSTLYGFNVDLSSSALGVCARPEAPRIV